jgi:hypothetical protein
MDWIKVLNRHTIFEYTDLSDSEFVAWIKIMSLTALMEKEPTREQMLKYTHHKTLTSLQDKLKTHSTTLQDILKKVLRDAQEVIIRREAWKNKKKKSRELKQSVPGDVSGDVSLQEKRREEKRREENKKIKEKSADALFVLPDFIPPETWQAYMTVRLKKRAAQTPYAFRLIIKELERLRDTFGNNPVEVLNKSITSGWADVYQLKNGKGGNGKKHAGIKAWLENENEETGQGAICEGDGGSGGDIRPGAGAVGN